MSDVANKSQNGSLKTSERFCDTGADVVFQSSDGVLFHVYRKYLEATAGAFPPPEISTNDEVVTLSEPAAILELLFQFIHPQEQPSVIDMDLDPFFHLAEAAEKYDVYGAKNTCRTRMYQLLDSSPMQVLNYAAKHRHLDLVDKVAPHTMTAASALGTAAAHLTHPEVLAGWVKYYDSYAQLAKYATDRLFASQHPDCCKAPKDTWNNTTLGYIGKVSSNPLKAAYVDATPGVSSCRLNCERCLLEINQELMKRNANITNLRNLI